MAKRAAVPDLRDDYTVQEKVRKVDESTVSADDIGQKCQKRYYKLLLLFLTQRRYSSLFIIQKFVDIRPTKIRLRFEYDPDYSVNSGCGKPILARFWTLGKMSQKLWICSNEIFWRVTLGTSSTRSYRELLYIIWWPDWSLLVHLDPKPNPKPHLHLVKIYVDVSATVVELRYCCPVSQNVIFWQHRISVFVSIILSACTFRNLQAGTLSRLIIDFMVHVQWWTDNSFFIIADPNALIRSWQRL